MVMAMVMVVRGTGGGALHKEPYRFALRGELSEARNGRLLVESGRQQVFNYRSQRLCMGRKDGQTNRCRHAA